LLVGCCWDGERERAATAAIYNIMHLLSIFLDREDDDEEFVCGQATRISSSYYLHKLSTVPKDIDMARVDDAAVKKNCPI